MLFIGDLNVSEIARVCDLSRWSVYKYISLFGNINKGSGFSFRSLIILLDWNY